MRYALPDSAVLNGPLNADELRAVRDFFILLDADGDGVIRLRDLHAALSPNAPVAWAGSCVAVNLFTCVDLLSARGAASALGALRQLSSRAAPVALTRGEMALAERAFDAMDVTGDGFVDAPALRRALRAGLLGDGALCVGERAADALDWLAGRVLSRADRDGDGRMSASDFIAAFLRGGGDVPPALLALAASPPAAHGRRKRREETPADGFSPFDVCCLVRAAARARSAAALRAALGGEAFQWSRAPAACVARRALWMCPAPNAVGEIDAAGFVAAVLRDPRVLRLGVAPSGERAARGVRFVRGLLPDERRAVMAAVADLVPRCAIDALDGLRGRLRAEMPFADDARVAETARHLTAAAEVTTDGFSLRRLHEELQAVRAETPP